MLIMIDEICDFLFIMYISYFLPHGYIYMMFNILRVAILQLTGQLNHYSRIVFTALFIYYYYNCVFANDVFGWILITVLSLKKIGVRINITSNDTPVETSGLAMDVDKN